MNQTATSPRARRTDPETSHKAARFATSQKAASERLSIYLAVCIGGDMTAREIAVMADLDYIEVQRRISEVVGLKKTEAVRDGCRVWSIA